MSTHKLDSIVEDTLKHYGISGMKWGVKRTEEQIAAAENAGGGGGGEVDESLLEELGDKVKDAFEALEKKLGSVSDSVKKKGKLILTSIFGKSETKYSKAKPDSKTTQKFRKAMKEYSNASPSQRSALKNGYTIRAESSISKPGNSSSFSKELSAKGYSGKAYSPKEADAIIEKYKKQGFKKHEKSKKTLAERGYKFRTESKK